MEYKEFYNKVNDYLQITFFLNVYQFVKNSGVAPGSTPDEILKTLCYLHTKGWLYYSYEDGKLVTVLGAYRIKEFDKAKIDVLPEVDEGDILFVPINASTSKDKLVYRKLLNSYLKEHKIKELIFFNRNSDEVKRFKIKGEGNEQKQNTESTEHATVLH